MAAIGNAGVAPAGYHDTYYADRDWRAYADVLAKVVRHSRPGPLLDLGAGCGYLVEAAQRWGIPSVGLEGSAEAIALARRRAPALDMRQHLLSEPVPFDSASFQTVVLNQVIEHLEPPVMTSALREAWRVLAPGGMVLITSPSCFNRYEWRIDPTHINLLSPSQLGAHLRDAGFTGIEPFDAPLPVFGRGRLGTGLAVGLFKVLRLERLSATANAIAYKPQVRHG